MIDENQSLILLENYGRSEVWARGANFRSTPPAHRAWSPCLRPSASLRRKLTRAKVSVSGHRNGLGPTDGQVEVQRAARFHSRDGAGNTRIVDLESGANQDTDG